MPRDVLDTDLWNDVTTYRLYTYLLLKATHQDHTTVNGIELKKGQWIRSYRKLAEDLSYKEGRGLKQYSLKTIKKCVDKLIKSGKVSVQETEVGTLFTVLEYAVYQGFLDGEEQTVNASVNEQETKGKRTGNNNKKANKADNAKNATTKIKYAEFVSLKESEYQTLTEKYGEQTTKEMINVLDNYKGANGKKYKSDYHAILNWVVERVTGNNKKMGNYRQNIVSIYQQGEESKKRQQAAAESVTAETLEHIKRMEREMPF